MYEHQESFEKTQTPNKGVRWSRGPRKCKFDEDAKRKLWQVPPGHIDHEKVKAAFDR